jgi:hypothetical protein
MYRVIKVTREQPAQGVKAMYRVIKVTREQRDNLGFQHTESKKSSNQNGLGRVDHLTS